VQILLTPTHIFAERTNIFVNVRNAGASVLISRALQPWLRRIYPAC
jgi:hypothetical protein